MNRKRLTSLCAGAMLGVLAAAPAAAEGTLRVAMTLADIPTLAGAPDQGTEGIRFGGYTLYDPLIAYDLTSEEKAAALRPSLATEWSVDPDDNTVWTFKLREGVKFHDGSDFNADAVIFSFDRAFDRDSAAFDADAERQLRSYIGSVEKWEKVDDYTVKLTTSQPDAFLPYSLTRFLIVSPEHFAQVGSWEAYRETPSGTGPWKLETLVPRQRAELSAFKEYWDETRVPKLDNLILLPVPEVSARTAALLSGRVEWAESPSPDTVSRLKSAGFRISTNAIPHMWPYTVSHLDSSPFHDIRVRKALNLAIDRDGLVQLLEGLAVPSVGNVPPDDPWFGNPSFNVRHDPEEARRLLAEAGYDESNPLSIKFAISTSGSGQMYPLLMNEFVQENFREVGVNLDLEVFEWEALRARRRAGADAPENAGIDAINNSWNSMDPYAGVLRFLTPEEFPPAGTNWGHIRDEETEALVREIRSEFDPARQTELLAKIHTRHVDNANFIWVVHDVGSRALSPKVKGHIHAKSWYVDFSPVYLEE